MLFRRPAPRRSSPRFDWAKSGLRKLKSQQYACSSCIDALIATADRGAASFNVKPRRFILIGRNTNPFPRCSFFLKQRDVSWGYCVMRPVPVSRRSGPCDLLGIAEYCGFCFSGRLKSKPRLTRTPADFLATPIPKSRRVSLLSPVLSIFD